MRSAHGPRDARFKSRRPDKLGAGAGGPYEWAEAWGPDFLSASLRERNEEVRLLYDRFPRPDSVEQAQLRDAPRRAEREALAMALAARSGAP